MRFLVSAHASASASCLGQAAVSQTDDAAWPALSEALLWREQQCKLRMEVQESISGLVPVSHED